MAVTTISIFIIIHLFFCDLVVYVSSPVRERREATERQKGGYRETRERLQGGKRGYRVVKEAAGG